MQLRTERLTGSVDIDGLEVDFEQITPAEERAIKKRHTKFSKKATLPAFDDIGYLADMFDKAVKDWRVVVDEDGNQLDEFRLPENEKGEPLECNTANKNAVCRFDQPFATKVIAAIGERIAKREKKAAKN